MIRKALPQDDSRIAEILVFTKRMFYRSIFNNDEYSFNQLQVLSVLETLKQRHTNESTYVYDDGIIKAMMTLTQINNELEIKELYVDYFFHRLGIGNQLLVYASIIATKQNCSTLFLWVLEANHNARMFYESQGFIQTSSRYMDPTTNQFHIKYCIGLSV